MNTINLIHRLSACRFYHQSFHLKTFKPSFDPNAPLDTKTLMSWEEKYAAQIYHPIPVVFVKAQGANVWDPEGRKYYDFLSAYSAVNQGHCHPKIVDTLVKQSQVLSLSSRAFFNSVFPKFAKYITELFQYERMNPMNSGAEAVETALKIARKWGYVKKGIPEHEAVIISCEKNFHGRTIGIISTSSDAHSKFGFGPYLPGYITVPYNDPKALLSILEKYGKRACAFLVEPIQGESGVHIPDQGYLKKCYDICKEHNVLFLADEIQTGLGRTGRMLCCDWESVRPDVLILGKALSGGLLPISCVLADDHVMSVLDVGSHGSTFGGNALASAVGMAALQVIVDEDLCRNSEKLGTKLLSELKKMKEKYPFIQSVRGKGLFAAIEMFSNGNKAKSAWDLCILLKDRGLLAKPTHDTIIRLAPPLVITEDQLVECVRIINAALDELNSK